MKNKNEYNWTTNRSTYNRLRKIKLERHGKIKCSLCGYHHGCNDDKKFYGRTKILQRGDSYGEINHRVPSWKLVTKNKKQWMGKKLDVIETFGLKYQSIEIRF